MVQVVTSPRPYVTWGQKVVTFCGGKTVDFQHVERRDVTFISRFVTSASRFVTIAALFALVACQTASGSFCQIAKPQRPSQAEIAAMSDARVAEVLALNRKGQKLCGWTP